MDLTYASAESLLSALRAGDVTSVELTDAAISRIERDDRAINAICVPDFDRARDAARAADRARARGEERPLLGIPVTVKESYDSAGLPTTWGMPEHRDHVPAEDAVQVARLRAAGAVVLGKTNVPLGLQDVQSFNEVYGATNNPWNHGRTPGGSSGGSAAALACGLGALSIGSDIAGSLRTPAHFCGVYAHKPTLGLAASRGMVPPTVPALPVDGDLAVVGPMARSARDLLVFRQEAASCSITSPTPRTPPRTRSGASGPPTPRKTSTSPTASCGTPWARPSWRSSASGTRRGPCSTSCRRGRRGRRSGGPRGWGGFGRSGPCTGAYLRVLPAARGGVERVGRAAAPRGGRRRGGLGGRAGGGGRAVRGVRALPTGGPLSVGRPGGSPRVRLARADVPRQGGAMSNETPTGTDNTLKTVIHVEDVEPHEVAPGILRRKLPATSYARGWLIDFAAGTEWPEIDEHDTEERYFVISGEVIDGGERHGPGTYVIFAPGSKHRPRTETGARMLGISLMDA
ncbi:amidase family protein [Streptomyces bacillaris]|uniref:amidase family protein n=1 Tax=Streptomyces bacillaris TaxID=68179 RepID=UPI003693FEA3